MKFQYIKIDIRKASNGDVIAFKHGTNKQIARWLSYYTDKPDYRYKFVTLNCAKYEINWIK